MYSKDTGSDLCCQPRLIGSALIRLICIRESSNMNPDYSVFTLPSALLRDFGIASGHKPRPIYFHHFSISFESMQYELGYYRRLSMTNKWIVTRHAPRDPCIPGKTTEHTIGTGRLLSPQSLPRVHCGMGKLADLPKQQRTWKEANRSLRQQTGKNDRIYVLVN
jgi:hypothetical protein